LKVAHISEDEIEVVVNKLKRISDQYQIDFVLSISIASKNTPESLENDILVSL